MQRKARLYILSIIALFAAVALCPDTGHCIHKGSPDFICSGCHTIHNSEGGAAKDVASGQTTAHSKMLRFNSDDLCYACHATSASGGGQITSTAPIVKDSGLEYSPTDPNSIGAAGNFAYLTNSGADGGANMGKGHNFSDTAMNPAGNMSKSVVMHCTTCHDPHGAGATDTSSVDSYRNLKLDPDNLGGGKDITNPPPGTSRNAHNVYSIKNNKYGITASGGSGMSVWCEQCHGTDLHGAAKAGTPARYTRHPMDVAMEEEIDFQGDGKVDVDPNSYDLDTASVLNGSGYIKLPLQDGAGSAANTNHCGNDTKDQVFCISCHFPHAGPYNDALRWNNSLALNDGVGCQQCHGK